MPDDQQSTQPPFHHNLSDLKESDRLSDFQVDERAAEAKAILDNPVFVKALDEVYSRELGILLNADVGSLTASTAHATMKALWKVRKQLEQYVTDQKMRQKFSKGESRAR